MSDLLSAIISSIPEFLAHALELELESAERYGDLADCMEVHCNPEATELFRTLAEYGERHAKEVQRKAEEYELPAIKPWEFKWSCPDAPESPCMEDANYLMNTCEALKLALHNEIRGRDFYQEVADTSQNPGLRKLAAEMAAEENDHVEMLQRWIAKEACSSKAAPEDLDPPNMPE